jgi:putative ABC transport system ATP-binding protein
MSGTTEMSDKEHIAMNEVIEQAPTGSGPDDASTPLYVLKGVGRDYSRGGVVVRAVRDIDLEIAAGEMISLEGPSGSGKSTLLLLLGALDVPTSGSLRFEGRELASAHDDVLTGIRADDIGFVFQQFNLIPTLTAVENVVAALAAHKGKLADQTRRATELLERVGLGHRLSHLPSRLSGGEQQRVAIARALANSPRVIIADEPTGNLDSETAAEVLSLIHELNATERVTVIIATHDESVASATRRRVRLRDGVVSSDSPA